jgi:hypothetical protein
MRPSLPVLLHFNGFPNLWFDPSKQNTPLTQTSAVLALDQD